MHHLTPLGERSGNTSIANCRIDKMLVQVVQNSSMVSNRLSTCGKMALYAQNATLGIGSLYYGPKTREYVDVFGKLQEFIEP